MAPLFTGLRLSFGRSAEVAVTPLQQYYFSSSDLNITLTSLQADNAKVVIVAGTGSNGSSGSGGNSGGPAPGGAGGQSNVRAYINVPFNSLAPGGTLNVKANYSDPFYSSAVQFQTPGTTGNGGALLVSNSNGTPYSNTSAAISALNSFTSVYSFDAGAGGPTQSQRGSNNGYAGEVGGGGAGGLAISLSSPPYPSDITTPLPPPPASVNANPGDIGGDLYKDPDSYAYGGSGGIGGSGVGAGGGGGGGGGGTGWDDWPAGQGSPGGSGGSGSPQRVFVAIKV